MSVSESVRVCVSVSECVSDSMSVYGRVYEYARGSVND